MVEQRVVEVEQDSGDGHAPILGKDHADSSRAPAHPRPMAARAAARTGAVTSRQRAAPAAKTSATYAASAARSAYRFCSGSSSATTASVTAPLSAPYVVIPSAVAAARLEDLDQVGDARLRAAVAPHRVGPGVGVGHRPRHLAAYDVRWVEQVHDPGAALARLAHLPGRVGQVHHPRARGRRRDLGDREHLAVRAVETQREVAGELDVLPLVVADRHPPARYSRMSAAISTG